MRTLTDHKVNGLNEALEITVLDEPGQGGACHQYQIKLEDRPDRTINVQFQDGPVKEAGFNGISQEALLAIVIDRLKGFQSGQFSTKENACALTHCQEALMWLQKRTRDRMARGVEGTNVK
jgi:hypothetical protein